MPHGLEEHAHHENVSSSRYPHDNNRPARPSSPLKYFSSSSITKPEDRSTAQKAWTANYLADLRTNRPARPSGSRPLVSRNACSTPILEPTLAPSSALAFSKPSDSIQNAGPDQSAATSRCSRAMSTTDNARQVGRPLAQQPRLPVASRDCTGSTTSTGASTTSLAGTYIERGQRRMEKQEARLLREALEEVDSMGEARLHAAAQDEASDLVWKHQNAGVAYSHQGVSHSSRPRVGQGHHSEGPGMGYTSSTTATRDKVPAHRSPSDDSTPIKGESCRSKGSQGLSSSSTSIVEASCADNKEDSTAGHELWDSPQKMAYKNMHFPMPQNNPFSRRRISGPISRKTSSGLFSNPKDKIYEEPQANKGGGQHAVTHPEPEPLKLRTCNSIAKLQSASHGFLRSKSIPEADNKKSRTEIQRNAPSQSRNPAYMQNTSDADPSKKGNPQSDGTPGDKPGTREGIEIRGEDIRAATSMRMKDRSTHLPSPTVISDEPGRPIVSFDRDWKPKESPLEQDRPFTQNGPKPLSRILPSKPQLPESTNSAPIIPTINAPDPPSIQVNDTTIPPIHVSSVPSINLSITPPISEINFNVPDTSVSSLPEPVRQVPSNRGFSRPSPIKQPLPHHSSTAPASKSAPHWSPLSHQRPTAQCAACALPIAGRIVSAASQRFHPCCFACFHCGELLECVAFYPEPAMHRERRLGRIEARASDPDVPDKIDGCTASEDGDSFLRFYCHLDFHELFSPRCRSCKTPIEGEVVLACGGEWHKGHFFCAQCGDPFDEKTPFVEKDGYAWCVSCHAGRFNGKCKGCKKVILEQGVQALGGEWHEACFYCVVGPNVR